MGAKSGRRSASRFTDPALREQLAQEAARLMVEGGIDNFGLAKRKAAERLGVRGAGALPSNAQIEACRAERQRIFEPEHDSRLTELRRIAVVTMEWLEPYRPRLVGPVLAGTATINSVIELHVFCDEPELVAATLVQHRVVPRDCQRRYRFSRDIVEQVPGFSFVWRGEQIDVLVFNERGAHHAPLSPVDQRPMRRAARGAVLALVD